MFILNMLLRITGFTQEGLANYLDVSRASINSWLADDSSMTETSKRNIAEKFQFPVSYFDIDLEQDIKYYKLIFSTIFDNWKRIKKCDIVENEKINKINDILNEVELDYNINLTEREILDGLINGYDPFTGELFPNTHILNRVEVRNLISKLNNTKYNNYKLSKEDLDEDEKKLFEELRKWRKDMYFKEGFFHAYMVFTDRELINIITANIETKEDLRNVKGIGDIKYKKYADDLYSIISTGHYDEDDVDNNYNFDDDAIIDLSF